MEHLPLPPTSCSGRCAPPAVSAQAPLGFFAETGPKLISSLLRRVPVSTGPYDTGEPGRLAAAIADPLVYDRARVVARYSSTMRELVQSFKYGDRHEGVAGRWRRQEPSFSPTHGAGPALLVVAVLATP